MPRCPMPERLSTDAADPRPFAEVLRDWIAMHELTPYAASREHGGPLSASDQTIRLWLRGRPCPYEREARAIMTMHGHAQKAATAVA